MNTILTTTSTLVATLVMNLILAACSDGIGNNTVNQKTIDNEIYTVSMMELMVGDITIATNTLWAVDEPTTDEQWKVLNDAAEVTLHSSSLLYDAAGDVKFVEAAKSVEWQVLTSDMENAALKASVAIENRNLDMLFEANDELYTPCESCHLKFNPGVINAETN